MNEQKKLLAFIAKSLNDDIAVENLRVKIIICLISFNVIWMACSLFSVWTGHSLSTAWLTVGGIIIIESSILTIFYIIHCRNSFVKRKLEERNMALMLKDSKL